MCNDEELGRKGEWRVRDWKLNNSFSVPLLFKVLTFVMPHGRDQTESIAFHCSFLNPNNSVKRENI